MISKSILIYFFSESSCRDDLRAFAYNLTTLVANLFGRHLVLIFFLRHLQSHQKSLPKFKLFQYFIPSVVDRDSWNLEIGENRDRRKPGLKKKPDFRDFQDPYGEILNVDEMFHTFSKISHPKNSSQNRDSISDHRRLKFCVLLRICLRKPLSPRKYFPHNFHLHKINDKSLMKR